jgi:integrase
MRIEKTRTPGIYKAVDESGKTISYRVFVKIRVEDALSPNGYRLKSTVETFDKEQDAIKAKRNKEHEIQSGKYVEPTDVTVKELVEKWIEVGKTLGHRKEGRPWKIQTCDFHKTHLDLYIAPVLGHFKASKLGKLAITQAAAKWKDQSSAVTANKVIGTLNAAYKFGLKNPNDFGIPYNPVEQITRLADDTTPEQDEALALGRIADYGNDRPEIKPGALRQIQPDEVYSSLELRRIIENANPELEKTLFMVAIFCGLRHGELNSLRWPMIDLKRKVLTVNRSLTQLSKKRGGPILETPKTRNGYRELPLGSPLVAQLREWKVACPPNANGFVFVDPIGRPLTRKQNNDMLKACCERAGVKALSMNNLRHSFASQHLMNGTAVLEVSYLMGHSSPAVTLAIYARWAKNEKTDSQPRLVNRILMAVDEKSEKSEKIEG